MDSNKVFKGYGTNEEGQLVEIYEVVKTLDEAEPVSDEQAVVIFNDKRAKYNSNAEELAELDERSELLSEENEELASHIESLQALLLEKGLIQPEDEDSEDSEEDNQ